MNTTARVSYPGESRRMRIQPVKGLPAIGRDKFLIPGKLFAGNCKM